MSSIVKVFAAILYFGLGFVQLMAIQTGLESLGLPWLLSVAAGIFVAYIPVLGSALGVWGAVIGWGLVFWKAVALMLGPFALFLALAAFSGVLNWIGQKRLNMRLEA